MARFGIAYRTPGDSSIAFAGSAPTIFHIPPRDQPPLNITPRGLHRPHAPQSRPRGTWNSSRSSTKNTWAIRIMIPQPLPSVGRFMTTTSCFLPSAMTPTPIQHHHLSHRCQGNYSGPPLDDQALTTPSSKRHASKHCMCSSSSQGSLSPTASLLSTGATRSYPTYFAPAYTCATTIFCSLPCTTPTGPTNNPSAMTRRTPSSHVYSTSTSVLPWPYGS